jgi:hypothetical protein
MTMAGVTAMKATGGPGLNTSIYSSDFETAEVAAALFNDDVDHGHRALQC